MRIPPDIYQQLQGHVNQAALDSAYYKVGDGGALNLSHLSLQIGHPWAVTLIDVIIFRGPTEVNDRSLWVHELKHVEQFRRWGVDGFAQRYMNSWNSVENEAYAAQDQYNALGTSNGAEPQQPAVWQTQQPVAPPIAPLPVQTSFSQLCVTPLGWCNKPPSPFGTSCACPTIRGWVGGIAR